MSLKHDQDGFLVGERVNIDTAGYKRMLSVLESIRSSTTRTNTLLEKIVSIDAGRASQTVAGPRRQAANDIRVPPSPTPQRLNQQRTRNTPRVRQIPQRQRRMSTQFQCQARIGLIHRKSCRRHR